MNESPFANIQVGATATRFSERITRVHHCTYAGSAPAWFTPTTNKRHNAAHRNGFSCYFEIEIDQEARDATHPFTTTVAPRSIFLEQLGLFAPPQP
jgi:hypothetical protein